MVIDEVLKMYDGMFGKKTLDEIGLFLDKSIYQASKEGDISSLITLLNEQIGFCRDTSQQEKALESCDEVLHLMQRLQLTNRLEYATTLLNVANAYRAFGVYEKAFVYYREVEKRYLEKLEPDDYLFASLYNNWSLLCQEVQDYKSAAVLLEKALDIIKQYDHAQIEFATTCTNLAATLLELRQLENAQMYLDCAIEIFQKDGGSDYHYSAALATKADIAYVSNQYQDAIFYYKQALAEIEKHVGKNDNYKRVLEKLYRAEEQYLEQKKAYVNREMLTNKIKQQLRPIFRNNMEACRYFYEKYFVKVIDTEFAKWKHLIAVGVSGEGSDCLGYDDAFSKDHDYGVHLTLWVTKETKEEIGEALQNAYQKSLFEFELYFGKNQTDNRHLKLRSGVMEIEAYFYQILGVSKFPETELEWHELEDARLKTATNGEIFYDQEGIVTNIRRVLSYYPEKVRLWKLAEALHEFSQCGQYNYPRMMVRGDFMTAKMCQYKAMEAAMSVVYLLNKTYAPYYKWMRRGIQDLELLSKVGEILDAMADMNDQRDSWRGVTYSSETINAKDKIVLTFEVIAKLLLREMVSQGVVSGSETYLDVYVAEIFALADKMKKERLPMHQEEFLEDKKSEKADTNMEEIYNLVEDIVKLEWKQFDGVINEGGRASCQDDFETFHIMRASQYLAWTRDLLCSYYNDLVRSENEGWNLIMEKYARMMEYTSPRTYHDLKSSLPVRSEERIAIQEEIIRIQMEWIESFAEKYPKLANQARVLHTSEDNEYETSYETYLRGEIGTYSEETFILYGRFVAKLEQEGKNLAELIMQNTVEMYGFESFEEAEKRL